MGTTNTLDKCSVRNKVPEHLFSQMAGRWEGCDPDRYRSGRLIERRTSECTAVDPCRLGAEEARDMVPRQRRRVSFPWGNNVMGGSDDTC